MTDIIFQASDLANRRTEFLDAARGGQARLRDKDGTSFVMLRADQLDLLQRLNQWSQALMRLESLLRRGSVPRVKELGDLAWLRVFDFADLQEFVEELRESLFAAHG